MPESGRSSPAIVISSVDLPEPEGPTSPVASPPASDKETPLRIWTRAAARPKLRWTSCNSIAGAGTVAYHSMILTSKSIIRPARTGSRREIASRPVLGRYGRACALVQSLAAVFLLTLTLALAPATMAHAQTQAKPLKLVALGDSLSAGYNLPGSAAFPAVLEQALRQKGIAVEIVNAGVSGDTAQGGLERLDWSVPDGTDGVILELGANDALRGVDPGADARRRSIRSSHG